MKYDTSGNCFTAKRYLKAYVYIKVKKKKNCWIAKFTQQTGGSYYMQTTLRSVFKVICRECERIW